MGKTYFGLITQGKRTMSMENHWEGEISRDQLLQRVIDFVEASTIEECRAIIEPCPDLLTEAADALLEELLTEAVGRGETYAYFQEVIRHRRRFLNQCAEEGVATAVEGAVENDWPPILSSDFELLREAEEREAYWLDKGTPEALDELKTIWQHALERPTLAEASADLRVMLLHRSGVAFARYYDATADVRGLQEAVRVWEEGLAKLPPGSPYRSLYSHSLSRALELLYHRTGREQEMRRAMAYAKEALAHTPEDSVDRAKRLHRIGVCYRFMYDRTGDSEYLERAIENFETAAKKASDELLPECLNDLGSAICLRFQHTGSIEDLRCGVRTLRKAVAVAPPNWPSLPSCLNNLGSALHLCYSLDGKPSDLDEAVEAARRAAELTPPVSHNLPAHLSSLGNALSDRYTLTGDSTDLEEALLFSQRAVDVTPASSPLRPMLLANYSAALHYKYLRTGDETVLQHATELIEEAASYDQYESPHLTHILLDLGIALKERYEQTGAHSDLRRAIAAFEEACRAGLRSRPSTTLQAVRNWGAWAMHREARAEAVRSYEYGMDAVDEVYRVQLLRDSKEDRLRETMGVFLQASLARTLNGDLAGAVTALERGRARMLAEAIGKQRTDLELLCAKGREGLYGRFVRASARVDRLTGTIPPTAPPLDVARIQQMHQARAELESAADEIRRVPGYEDFLAPPTYSKIEEAAISCPLVYLATPAGTAGLGFIVDSNGTSSLRFPELTFDALIGRLVNSADANRLGGYSKEYFRWRADPDDEQRRRSWFAALEATTEWLWDSLVGPLTAALSHHGHDQAVLIPMGLLGILPLHAAWTQDNSQPCGRRYALDDFCIRYAPNARTLHATDEVASRVEADSLLVVVEPEPVSATPLPAAKWEADMARSHFAAEKCQMLAGSDAIREEVLKSLAQHAVFQFSGHAYANSSWPLQGGLLMAGDKLLTVADLLAIRLEESRLVVISACETGIPGVKVPDEVVGLPSAFVQAGTAGAVGSLWIVDDLTTALLIAQFYELWREHGVAPAEALRQAQISVRDVGYGEEATRILSRSPRWRSEQEETLADLDLAHPFYWASFTYTGS